MTERKRRNLPWTAVRLRGNHGNKRFRQCGLTLVETMVALVISLLLLAGLVTVFASMRSSFATTSRLNHLVNQERLASDVIGGTLANAGYYPIANRAVSGLYHTPADVFPAEAITVHTGLAFAPSQVIYGTGADTPGSRDAVAIRMLTAPGDTVLDCQGGTNKGVGNEFDINVFWVDTTKNQLMCTISRNGGVSYSAPLIGGELLPVKGTQYGGVTSLVAVYGVDTDASGSVDRYMSADALNADANRICPDTLTGTGNASSCWPYVRSVRITLGIRSALAPDKTLYLTRNVVLANAIGRNVNPPGLAPPIATAGGNS